MTIGKQQQQIQQGVLTALTMVMTTERKKELLELKKAKRRKDSQKCYNKKKAMQATKHKMLSLSDEAARKRKYRANINVQDKFVQKKK